MVVFITDETVRYMANNNPIFTCENKYGSAMKAVIALNNLGFKTLERSLNEVLGVCYSMVLVESESES